MPPRTIAGRYEAVREIGRGGMGAVWLCRDTTLGREVAVKQVGGLPGESTPHLTRALREARSSAALNHPNVVSIFDVVEDGGGVWLVMEHLPSRTLSQLLVDGPLDERRAARIGAQVADGLAAAHARGTVHRDVKPGNVLVTDDDVAKISDFGIARTLGDDQLTRTGLVAGTPLYFSPALARGADPTPADDVWALGASLWTAVEGGPPWPPQENAVAMLVHIAEHDPPATQRASALAGPIRRMMDPDPAARPSMGEVAALLHRVAEGGAAEDPTAVLPAPTLPATTAVVGSGAGAAVGSRNGSGRRRGPVVLLVAAVVLAVALGAAALGGLLGDEDGPTAAEDPAGTTSQPPPDDPADRSEEPAPPAEGPAEDEAEQAGPPEDDAPAAAGGPADAEAAVQDYYALLPDDVDAAWARLSPRLQDDIGYDSFSGFWSTVGSVEVTGTRAVGRGGVVEVDLTYDGSQSETRRITVRDGLLVADRGP